MYQKKLLSFSTIKAKLGTFKTHFILSVRIILYQTGTRKQCFCKYPQLFPSPICAMILFFVVKISLFIFMPRHKELDNNLFLLLAAFKVCTIELTSAGLFFLSFHFHLLYSDYVYISMHESH